MHEPDRLWPSPRIEGGPGSGHRVPGGRILGRRGGDPRGNERLTAMTGSVLLVLFLAECLTLLDLGNMLTLHVFLGFLLLGPVSLKIGSTLWRFTRYYTRSEPYVRRGPPHLAQRILGPFVILSTVAVLGTGVVLAFQGQGQQGSWQWHSLHREAFLVWVVVIVLHLASYVPKLPGLLARRPGEKARAMLAASRTRWLLLAGSLAAGLVLALVSYHLSANWGGSGSLLP
jgi:hypothetical protein